MQSFYRWEESVLKRSGLPQLLTTIAAQKNIMLFAGLMIVLAYGYEIFNFSMRIDSEWYGADFGVKTAWLAEGRWGMHLLSDWLLPDSVMPVVPSLLAVVGLAVGGLLWLASMQQLTKLQAYSALAFLICCPIYYFVVYFTILGFGVGVACSCIGLATYLLFKKNIYWSVLSIACYTLAIGTYQAMVLVALAAYISVLLEHSINRHQDWRDLMLRTVQFVICLALGLALALLLGWWLAADVGRDFAYIRSHSQVEWSWAYWLAALEVSAEQLFMYYAGDEKYYLYPLPLLKLLFVALLLLAVARIICLKVECYKKIIMVLLLIALTVSPMCLLLIGNGEMPPRAQMAIAWTLAGIVVVALGVHSVLIKSLLLAMLIPVIFKFIVVDNRYSFLANNQWQADKQLSSLVLSEIQRVGLPPQPERSRYRIEIVGTPKIAQKPNFVKREAIGASLYVWDDGRAERIRYIFDAMGVNWFWAAKVDERKKIMTEAYQMPNWPRRGSIKVVANTVVVKFGDYTNGQLIEICGTAARCD